MTDPHALEEAIRRVASFGSAKLLDHIAHCQFLTRDGECSICTDWIDDFREEYHRILIREER